MKYTKKMMLLAVIIMAGSFVFAQEEDAEGCSDYPMFNRMPNFYLSSCDIREFDAYKFVIENSMAEEAKAESVEGKYYEYFYTFNSETTEPSPLQIFRNFETAFKQIKATVVGKVVEHNNSYSFINAKVQNGKNETWIRIETSGTEYHLVIVERDAMVQVIQANDILAALNKDGYIALDILFDTGKSIIKSESQSIIDEIYKLLSTSDLKVSIEGHTDNVGNAVDNKKLSDSRAKSVLNALVAKGIKTDRLTSVGWGQEKPVADNRSEDGRVKNRRVEIVKK
jgi:outer membrane protein OmpA-like peptidoglycan-associated protein